jgi:ribosomal protein S18 acetylase RimI-like enzyme
MTSDKTIPRERIRSFLATDAVATAYPLSYLDRAYSEYCEWHEVVVSGELHAIGLVYRGLRLPALMTWGQTDAVAALLSVACQKRGASEESGRGAATGEAAAALAARRSGGPGAPPAAGLPREVYAQIAPEHLNALLAHYRVDLLRRVVRMAVSQTSFRPPADLSGVERVGHGHTADLMELYRFYPDAFFEPHQLGSGHYFGARAGESLVAVAGVHSVSAEHGVAVIGNVVTHPEHRNRGLSTRCTGKLVGELLQAVPVVALDVDESNLAALRTYEKLGFAAHSLHFEGVAQRRV